jgi:hypothetical protein
MAEYSKVQFQEGADGEPKVDTAMEEAKAEAAAESGEESAPSESLEIDAGDGLQNVIEKFDGNLDKMAEGYRELEQKLSSRSEPEEAPTAAGLEDIQPYVDEWQKTGELSEDSRKALESRFPKDLIDDYLAKSSQAVQYQEAQAATELKSIYDSVGGEQNYQEVVAWAAENLSVAQIGAYNEAVNSGSLAQAELAVQGLAAQYGQTVGSKPKLLQSKPGGSPGGAPYESLAQVTADMKKPEYKTDPAFRQAVQARLSRSNVM